MGAKVALVTHIIMIKQPTTLADVIPFLLVFIVYGIIVQILFAIWKKFHERSFNLFVLFAIIGILPAVSLITKSYLSILLYIAFMLLMADLSYIALNFKRNKEGLRIIFNTFKTVFMITNHATVLLQIVMVVLFLTKYHGMYTVLKLMSTTLYYAVLSREIVRNLCLLMAVTIGYRGKDRIPGKSDDSTACMICTLPFGESTGKIVTLGCKHPFHEACIKGWCLIGQNPFCYYCTEKIDNSIFSQDYWLKSELFIKPMMNTMRSMIAFSIFAVLFYHFL
ncbi:hypothetical protein GINT2_001622 [Glugoides intestinalis]